MPDELIVEETETTETEGEEIQTETTTTVVERQLTDDDELEIARKVAQKNPEALSHYFQPAPKPDVETRAVEPTDHFADITDDLGYVDPKKLAAAQKAQAAETQTAILRGVQNMMTPLMQGFAAQQATSGMPEEVRPYAQAIADELGVSLYQAAQDPKVMKIVRNAAYGEAWHAGKLKVPAVEEAEPVGGASRTTFTDAQRMALADYVRIKGGPVTSKEAEDLRKSGVLG